MVLANFYLATLTVAVAILVSYVGSLRLFSVFYGLTDNTKEFQKAMETRYKTSKTYFAFLVRFSLSRKVQTNIKPIFQERIYKVRQGRVQL